MNEINIEGIFLNPLKIIHHPKGDILHGVKKSDKGFVGFGEVYFSTVKGNEIKGWNRHKRMTLNLVVPFGSVTFVIYDDREKKISESSFFKVKLSPKDYQRLTIPPGLWIAFKGSNKSTNLILNLSNIEHDPNEIEKLNLNNIYFNWDSV